MKHFFFFFFLQAPCITFNLKVLGRSADVDLAEELVQAAKARDPSSRAHLPQWGVGNMPKVCWRGGAPANANGYAVIYFSQRETVTRERLFFFFFFMLWYKSPNPVRSQAEKPGLIKKKKKKEVKMQFSFLFMSLSTGRLTQSLCLVRDVLTSDSQ